ncbi:insulinase family protein [Marinobacteraceae bacterium S3BR75-40.1]
MPASPQGLLHKFVVLVALLSLSALSWALTPEKSPNDARQYCYLKLDNGMQVLLITDPQSTKGAAALDIEIGSGDDPEDRLGMAHFLEHMLFLGTEKYPDPGAYQSFISAHGGNHNAMTSFGNTNYFFDVEASALEPALDRFAQQFVAPTFTAELVDRERNAVHSEYSSKLRDDGRRAFSALKQALNPEHHYSRFAVGNLETLHNEDGKLRKDLIDFYKTHYTADLMNLVVYGPQSLDQLQTWVKNKFSAVPERPVKAYEDKAPLIDPQTLPKVLKVESLKDIRRLQLSFPIPSTQAEYRDKPSYYLSNLIGHEGPGSLLDVLKKAGLANALSAGQQLDTGNHALFDISISLTPEGYENWRKVARLTFDYIDLIRQEGIRKPYFEEQSKLAQIDFRFKEAAEPIHEVSRLASTLHDVAPVDILQAPWMMEHYRPDAYRELLQRLRPNNVLLSVLGPKTLDKAQKTPHFEAPYLLEQVAAEALDATDSDRSLSAKLALPAPNPFVPENLAMVSGATMEKPTQLQEEPFPVWYARDTSFGTPKANVLISLRSPMANSSPRERVLTRLWVDGLNDQLNAYAYAARLAGLDYSLYDHLRGVTIRVGGYDDKLDQLLQRILLQVASPDLDREQFGIHRKQLIDQLRNKVHDKPYIQAMSRVSEVLVDDIWKDEDELKAAEDVTFDELRAFARQFRKKLDPVMLVNGNTTRAAALNLAGKFKAFLLDDSEMVNVPRSQVARLEGDTRQVSFSVEHPDTGYVRYLQGRNTSIEEQARYMLLGQIVSAPFYQQLRTEEQLGYIVNATHYPLLDVPGVAFLVQSPKADAGTLDQRVQAFLNSFAQSMANMSKADFQQQKEAVVARLSERDKTLSQVSSRYWHEIDRENEDFDTRASLIEAIRAINEKPFLSFYNDQIEKPHRSLLVTTHPSQEGSEMASNVGDQ